MILQPGTVEILKNPDGSADITFTAASDSELISFILSLGETTRILKPQRLVWEIMEKIVLIYKVYVISSYSEC
jgi:predicted DNA-binding transcriptional regulator YafY